MIQLIYKTGNGTQYPLDLDFRLVSQGDIYYEPEYIRGLCQSGCSNYGKSGGCPPRSPFFTDILKENTQVLLLICRFDSAFKPINIKNSNNVAIHWKFQDGILARLLNNIGRKLRAEFGGIFLATGYCMGCPGQKCSFKLGSDECRRPEYRTYSMEATGINVVKTVESVFKLPIYWYKKGDSNAPYMLKCIALIPDVHLTEDKIKDMLNRTLVSVER